MTQQWDPEQYERDGGFVSDYGREVVGILNPQPGERILDLGCGDGRLSEFIESGPVVVWLPIDSSPGANLGGARSPSRRAGCRRRKAAVPRGVRRRLQQRRPALDKAARGGRPGGLRRPQAGGPLRRRARRPRQHRLHPRGPGRGPAGARTRVRGPQPLVLPRREAVLQAAARPPGSPSTASSCSTGRRRLLRAASPGGCAPSPVASSSGYPTREREGFLAGLAAALEPALRRDGGEWFVDYVRLRFAAAKPA